MIGFDDLKVVTVLPPQLKNNGAFAGNTYVDTHKAGSCRFLFLVGETDAAVGSTDAAHALKIEECDTTNGQYTDVENAALSAVIAANDDNLNFAIDIDLRKTHKRYMRPNAPTADNQTTGCNLTILAILGDLEVAPDSAAERGLEEHIHA